MEFGLFHPCPRLKRQNKKARKRIYGLSHFRNIGNFELALAGFITLVRLVDDVNASAALDNLAVTVAFFDCFQRVNDLHNSIFRSQSLELWADNSQRPQPCQGFIGYRSGTSRSLLYRPYE